MKQLCLFFFFLTLSLQAQFQVNGIVKEAVTNKPLPFATITTNNGLNSISDVDGKFSIITVIPFTSFDISYIGFTKTRIVLEKNKNYYVVILSQKTAYLNEVVVPSENPALAIIRKAIKNKDNNNPQKNSAVLNLNPIIN